MTDETDKSYKTAEIFDPTTGKFTPTGSMTEERTCAMATLLPNGRPLLEVLLAAMQAGWHYTPLPESRIIIGPSDVLAIELDTAPGAAMVFNAWAVFEEIGQ